MRQIAKFTTRLCLDRLRASRSEWAQYVGQWLPEPLVADLLPLPEERLEMANELSIAFLTLLERLGPEERAVFLLRDVFDDDYPDIAAIVGKAEAACRQALHRARLRIREGRPRFAVAEDARENLLDQFLTTHVQFQLDVVGCGLVDDLGLAQVLAHEFARSSRGENCDSENFLQFRFLHLN